MTHWDASEFSAVVDEFAARLAAGQERAARTAAEVIKALAQGKTPVETGNLRGSADVRPAGRGGTWMVYYPGPYARYQHFGLDFRHETGQALFLEMALIEGKDAALSAAAAVLRGG